MHDVGAPPLLEVDIVEKVRSRDGAPIDVIKDLRFSLSRHRVTCLLGPSGCGKTTALRIVMGLDTVYRGQISPTAAHLRIGVVFQDPRLLPWRTVEENVRLVAPSLSKGDLKSLLSELGLVGWGRNRPNELSLGMARRVALARALAVEPDLLVLDEAFVSLDERGADTLRTVVFDAVSQRRATVLMVTHNVREALQHSDTVLVLAPRPTHVLERLEFDRPRAERDTAWLTSQRDRLLAVKADFLDAD